MYRRRALRGRHRHHHLEPEALRQALRRVAAAGGPLGGGTTAALTGTAALTTAAATTTAATRTGAGAAADFTDCLRCSAQDHENVAGRVELDDGPGATVHRPHVVLGIDLTPWAHRKP